MDDIYKLKLIDLGAETLANALLKISEHSTEAYEYIEVLLSSPEDNIDKFKQKFSSLKRSKRFISRSESSYFARELTVLLQNLKSSIKDPLTGVQLICNFFEADRGVLGHCDDSNGTVGDLFRFEARNIFIEYANRCKDKEKVVGLVLKLNKTDNYGIRDTLIHCAIEYLSETEIRTIIQKLEKRAEKDLSQSYSGLETRLIASLARQIKDAELFEKTQTASFDNTIPSPIILDIAEVYFESENFETALSWIKEIPLEDHFHTLKQDELLLKIYQKQGNIEKLSELLYKEFRDFPSECSLQALIDVIGSSKREETLVNQTTIILSKEILEISDLQFLVSVGKVTEAENQLFNLSKQINGHFYDEILSLIKVLESESRPLACTILYRELLNSILERAYTKSYTSGVRYLKKLGKLSISIIDWKGFDNHDSFNDLINLKHSRKRSFWSKYNK